MDYAKVSEKLSIFSTIIVVASGISAVAFIVHGLMEEVFLVSLIYAIAVLLCGFFNGCLIDALNSIVCSTGRSTELLNDTNEKIDDLEKKLDKMNTETKKVPVNNNLPTM